MEDDVPVEDLMKLKLIVVGNQGTGKSCILNRFVNETFEENYQATIGLYKKQIKHVFCKHKQKRHDTKV